MGNDGGDIPRRKQLVKEKKKVQVASTQSIARSRARYCNFTNSKFKQPLAICRLGCLYNYEAILDALIKKILPSKFAYITGLKDIKKIKVQRTSQTSDNFLLCPITKIEFNGFNKFVCLWKCGHVLSRKAFKQIKNEDISAEKRQKKCMICTQQYEEQDVIDMNLENSELEKKRSILIKKAQEKQKRKRQKQAKKNILIDEINEGQPKKKVKLDTHLNTLDRLGGQFRDVLRQRQKFKEVFQKKVI